MEREFKNIRLNSELADSLIRKILRFSGIGKDDAKKAGEEAEKTKSPP